MATRVGFAIAGAILSQAYATRGPVLRGEFPPSSANSTALGDFLAFMQRASLLADPLDHNTAPSVKEAPTSVQDAFVLDLGEMLATLGVWFVAVLVCAYFFHKYRDLPDADPALENAEEWNKLSQWHVGIFNCFEAPDVFCMALCCPAILWAHTMNLLGVFAFWIGFMVFFGLSVMNAFTAGVLGQLILAVLCTYYRQAFRKVFGMEHGDFKTFMSDCCLFCFCSPCLISQEAQHVRHAAHCGHEAVDRDRLKNEGLTLTPRAAESK